MTDPLTPNDLSHLSDDEFNALCPQGEHAPGPEPLSPAALAVWDAAWDCPIGDCRSVAEGRRHQIAAALRAAADQALPEKHINDIDYVHQMYTDGCRDTIATLLAIADELEAQ